MHDKLWARPASWLVGFTLSVFSFLAWAAPEDHVLDDSFKYVTRPDIEAPRWHVTVYDKDRVAPGYWFVEPYDYLDQSLVNGGKWTAPMIFDETGELIWSGAYLSQQYDSFDFRLSNVLGNDMLTFLYVKNKTAIFMDTNFNIQKTVQTSLEGELENMHELHFVDNGTRALYFYDETKNVTKSQSESIGFYQWQCPIRENSIRELDLNNNQLLFSWSSSDHIELTDSTFTERTVEDRCTNMEKGWDYIHCNSLDKFPDDGAYLMSGRYTDTIYKISRDGDIVWRLGGDRSDFESDFKFARQHHARILEHNATHTVLSFHDNAKAEDYEEAATPYSRGLIVALSTAVRPMTATMLREYPHPRGEGAYSLGRGSTQVLPGGNVFSCWVSSCLHSEHTEDGKLVMEAQVKQDWLKSYRSYKYPFVGRPSAPPDIHSTTESVDGRTKTVVYASWNGATEVTIWLLYKADITGKHWELLASSPRAGFETAIEYDGYAKYVFVEALDSHRQPLGRSIVLETVVVAPVTDEVIASEDQWLQKQPGRIGYWTSKASFATEKPLGISSFWIMSSVALAVVGRMAYRWRRKATRR